MKINKISTTKKWNNTGRKLFKARFLNETNKHTNETQERVGLRTHTDDDYDDAAIKKKRDEKEIYHKTF